MWHWNTILIPKVFLFTRPPNDGRRHSRDTYLLNINSPKPEPNTLVPACACARRLCLALDKFFECFIRRQPSRREKQSAKHKDKRQADVLTKICDSNSKHKHKRQALGFWWVQDSAMEGCWIIGGSERLGWLALPLFVSLSSLPKTKRQHYISHFVDSFLRNIFSGPMARVLVNPSSESSFEPRREVGPLLPLFRPVIAGAS
jgi:hypothetical protein